MKIEKAVNRVRRMHLFDTAIHRAAKALLPRARMCIIDGKETTLAYHPAIRCNHQDRRERLFEGRVQE
jgi:hypothetical protein